MKETNNSSVINSLLDFVNILFSVDKICRVSNKILYIVILFLSFIAHEGYKIIICHLKDYIYEKERIKL